LSDERLRELLEVQAYFGLPSPALVEKDFYVVKALAAIAAIDSAPLRLVFSGGTALSRVRRMSEDIDLRIVSDRSPDKGALRHLRDAITQALLSTGFKFDPRDPAYRKSGNESRYMIYRLPYEPAATGEGALWPTIQIEMAADKFVGLKRLAGAEIADLDEPDSTLVRHLHDLHALREHYDPADLVPLARARLCSRSPRPTAISSRPAGITRCARRCAPSKGLWLNRTTRGSMRNFCG
jgi:Nucleotidyl transferase AbiEii toxin, Type IV TA system